MKLSPAGRAEHLLVRFGAFDEAHHKAFAIDQVLRTLMGPERYLAHRTFWESRGYNHDEGIAP